MDSHADRDEALSRDEKLALALYTFDLGIKLDWRENFYYKLNKMLKERSNDAMLMWQGYLYYFFAALKKLNNIKTTVYRGINYELEQVQQNYQFGSKIHWSSFSSTTTEIQVAKKFALKSKILFIISILTGKDIQKYSVVKGEKEILLNPNMSFVVFQEPHFDEEGYWCVNLVQIADSDTYIF